jgi:hypothetical protein
VGHATFLGVRFSVIDVSTWPVVSQETGGLEPKDWICPPELVEEAAGREHLLLFKPVKMGLRPRKGGDMAPYRRHDDEAERIAALLATVIGLPSAEVQLARGVVGEGIISRNVTPDGWDIQGGDVSLSEIPGYVSCAGDMRPRERRGHNLENIRRVLKSALGPPGLCEDWAAFDVFVGYLAFDAWIANTDRHAYNWAILSRGSERRLAASFDHGSALASGVPDEDLLDKDPIEFSHNGRAGRFEGGSTRSLVELATEGRELAGAAASEWFGRIAGVDRTLVEDVVGAVPRMSVVRHRFLTKVLMENARRLAS